MKKGTILSTDNAKFNFQMTDFSSPKSSPKRVDFPLLLCRLMGYTLGETSTSSRKGKMMVHDLDALRRKIEIISGGTYSHSLTTVDPTQVLYNGKFSYLTSYTNPRSGGWCHLLVLRSKNNYSKQLLAIITQTPDYGASIVNFIEDIATFTINFFSDFYPPLRRQDEDPDASITMTSENTIFVEYLPAGCFGPRGGHKDDTFAVMNFDWEEVSSGQWSSYYQAKSSGMDMWKHTRLEKINDLIVRL